MSTDAPIAGTGAIPAGSVADGLIAERADTAGRLLRRLSLLPALILIAWLLAGLPLLLANHFAPVPMLVVALPLAVAIAVLGLRWIPDRSKSVWAEADRRPSGTPWWTLAALLAVAVAFGVQQYLYHSQQIIVGRDPASYVQFGYWIAHHGSAVVSEDSAAFGGVHKGLIYGSLAFYQDGNAVVPQFMAGLPMVLGAGYWIGGVNGALLMGPLLGAMGVLTFGGLAARLVGPRWAPVAALVLALTLPEQFTSRSTYSEPLTQILLFGGLCLVIDSLSADGAGSRAMAALGGLALGLTVLVRIDGASDILPVIPYCGLLVITARRQALPLAGGLALGVGYGVVDGLVLSKPYLVSIKTSVAPLALVVVVVIVLTELAVLLMMGRGLPKVRGKLLPAIAAAVPVGIILAFVIRPYVQTARQIVSVDYRHTIMHMQRSNHLPIDGTRTYAEQSLHWVVWYVGVPAVLLAAFGAALLARRCALGRGAAWTLPLITFGWIIVSCLYRPAITPDHPWASRRLVPGVLPGFILLAVWAVCWLVAWTRRRGFGLVAGGTIAGLCVLSMALPAAAASFGIRAVHGGPAGVTLAAKGLAVKTTYRGEVAAVQQLCASIPGDASVVILTKGVANRFAEVIRGMCGDPVAHFVRNKFITLEAVVRGIARAGRLPVLLASSSAQLSGYGGTVREILNLRTYGDQHSLVTPPLRVDLFTDHVWMTELKP